MYQWNFNSLAVLILNKIIPISFLINIGTPTLNMANAGDNCTAFSGSTLFDCPQLAYVFPNVTHD
jgi:hypothetical protein